jgi:hypothetical protein
VPSPWPLISPAPEPSKGSSWSVRFATLTTWFGALAIIEPLVGVAWQRALADALGLALDIRYSALLAVSLWLVYIADRWLDAGVLRPDAPCSARHRFSREHRSGLALAWLCGLVLDVGLAIATLDAIEWAARVGLLITTCGYFWGVHSRLNTAPKELLVAGIYSAGITVFAWPQMGWPWTWRFATSAALLCFALLALLNLATIALAERALDEKQGFPTLGKQPAAIERGVNIGSVVLLACSIAFAGLFPAFQTWFIAVGGCTLLLSMLNRWRIRFDPDVHHLAADAVLLLPFVLPMRFSQ